MRYSFHDTHFNINSKDKDLPCECQSKTNDNSNSNPLSQMNRRNTSFWKDRDTAATQPELEAKWNQLEKESRDKVAAATSDSARLKIMNAMNAAFWAAKGVRP